VTKSLPEKQTFKRSPAGSSGFTLIEILIAIAIVAIISAISFPIYKGYIDKARITIGINTLETARKSLEEYHINNGNYPPTIEMTTGEDGQGVVVLQTMLLNEFRQNFFSIESYIVSSTGYTLKARAIDTSHSLLVLTPEQVITQGL